MIDDRPDVVVITHGTKVQANVYAASAWRDNHDQSLFITAVVKALCRLSESRHGQRSEWHGAGNQ
ncbi:hypothetical protein EFS38_14825 [Dickeya undicola]|uniref:Uncharacterized protein n=1 Tax=Dickeya undicola TaxID=1577887 RepID=A0ABX9WTJ2_9GAMM|nr:hypothetical protein EFS38_14825 [Dickeya undicola]